MRLDNINLNLYLSEHLSDKNGEGNVFSVN